MSNLTAKQILTLNPQSFPFKHTLHSKDRQILQHNSSSKQCCHLNQMKINESGQKNTGTLSTVEPDSLWKWMKCVRDEFYHPKDESSGARVTPPPLNVTLCFTAVVWGVLFHCMCANRKHKYIFRRSSL